MVLRVSDNFYSIDPEDPRAPSQAVWDRMSPEERAGVVAALPSDFTLDAAPPEGDRHAKAATGARFTLDDFFRRIGRKIYISSNLAVYYPGERCFAPDVLAVRDVEPGDRDSWIVSAEGKGLDLVIEVHVSGNRARATSRTSSAMRAWGSPSTSTSIVTGAFYAAIDCLPDKQRRILHGAPTNPSCRRRAGCRPRSLASISCSRAIASAFCTGSRRSWRRMS